MAKVELFDEKTLPVSIDPGTKGFVTAQDVQGTRSAGVRPLENLDDEELRELVVERIKRGPERQPVIFGQKPITKEQAVREVQAKSPMGEDLLELHRRAIQMTLKDVNP